MRISIFARGSASRPDTLTQTLHAPRSMKSLADGVGHTFLIETWIDPGQGQGEDDNAQGERDRDSYNRRGEAWDFLLNRFA